jgi:hypothetical protein
MTTMERRVTFCPYCGGRVLVTLAEPAQVTIAHAHPLCLQAVGAVEAIGKAIARFQLDTEAGGPN